MLLAGTVVIVMGSQSCCWPLTRVVSWDSCCGHGVNPAVDHLLVSWDSCHCCRLAATSAVDLLLLWAASPAFDQ